MPKKVVGEDAMDEAIRLGIAYTNSRVKGLSTAYDQKFANMTSVLNSMNADMHNFIDTANDKIAQMEQIANKDGVIDAINALSQKIDSMNSDLNGKIDSLKQDVDNLDTQVNGIAGTVSGLSTDLADVKSAMGRMIVNIVPDGSGGLTIHHYDGTIDANTVVEEMSSDDVDTIIGNYESSGITE